MIILYLILFAVVLSSIRLLNKGESWNADYISKSTTNVIKGICIWMVFIRHISSYMYDIPNLNEWDRLLFSADAYVKQLLVVPFLFYSGYGVTLAMMKDKEGGNKYADNIPAKRVLPTLINYDIAVFFFLLMNIALGFELEWRKVILAFTGWESIRNSNWYIFCILICYLISWASYKLSGSAVSKHMIIIVWGGILLYTAVLYFFKGHWWYDTIYSYGAGVIFAYHKEKLEDIIKHHYKALLIISSACFLIFYNAPNYFCIPINIAAVFLCLLIVLFTSKVKLQSNILAWSGSHLFPLYIYQRLPMVVLSTIYGGAFMEQHRYLYIICCFAITLLIASIYKGYTNKSNVMKFTLCQKKA